MSVVRASTSPSKGEANVDPHMFVHVSCICQLDVALCGMPVDIVRDDDDVETECVVCAELEPLPCPNCGAI